MSVSSLSKSIRYTLLISARARHTHQEVVPKQDQISPHFERLRSGYISGTKQLTQELEEKLKRHKDWLEGEPTGVQFNLSKSLDLSEKNFYECDLRKAVFTGANLQGCNFRGCDLSGADFSNSNVAYATFAMSNLHGALFSAATTTETEFRSADARHVDFMRVKDLTSWQLAGVDLSGAQLPNYIKSFEALELVAELSRRGRNILNLLLAFLIFIFFTLITTDSLSLLRGSVEIKFPFSGTTGPVASFYLFAPFIILIPYVYLLFHYVELSRSLSRLPAVFPNGLVLHDRIYPWLLRGFALPPFRARRIKGMHYRLILERSTWVFFICMPVGTVLFLIWWWCLPLRNLPLFWTQMGCAVFGLVVTIAAILLRERHFNRQPGEGFYRPILIVSLFALIAPIQVGVGKSLFDYDFMEERAIFRFHPLAYFDDSAESSLVISAPIWLTDMLYINVSGKLVSVGDKKRCGEIIQKNSVLEDLEEVIIPNRLGNEKDFYHPDDLDLRNRTFRFGKFSNAKMEGVQMDGTDLSETDFTGTQIDCASLNGVNFGKSVFSNASMRVTKIVDAKFDKSDFSEANVSYSDVRNGKFFEVNLQKTKFFRTRLGGSEFRSSDLSWADLRKADLHKVKVTNGSMKMANMTGATADGIKFSAVNLESVSGDNVSARLAVFEYIKNGRGASFRKSIMQDSTFNHTNFVQSNFSGAVLSGSKFERAIFKEAKFKNADLHGIESNLSDYSYADFQGADLTKARFSKSVVFDQTNFEAAILISTDLRGANLRSSMGLDAGQIRSACIDETTALPRDLDEEVYDKDLAERNCAKLND